MKKEDPNLEEKVFADCADFLGEKSSLMHLGKVDHFTKGQIELTDKGFEYLSGWGN